MRRWEVPAIIPRVQSLLDYLGPWALVPVFLMVALESCAFVGLVFPGETVAFIAGAIAGAGIVSPLAAFATVAAGAALGDIGGYLLGRLKGRAVLAWSPLAHRAYERSRPRMEKYFARWGAMTVVIGRFVAVGRVFAPFSAGLSGMPARTFMAAALVSAALWSALLVAAGYLLGSNWRSVTGWVASLGFGMLALLVLTVLMAGAYEWLVTRQEEVVGWWRERILEPLARRNGVDLAPLMDFIRARFSPTGYLGFHLTVGLLVLGAMMWLFGGIVQDIFAQDPLVRVDRVVAAIITHARAPAFDCAMVAAGWLSAPAWLGSVVAITVASLLAARDRTRAILAIPVAAGAYVLGFGIRDRFENFSPHVSAEALVHGFHGFPSVAMTAATAVYGFAWFAIVMHLKSWRIHALCTVGAVYLILLAGLGELYRGKLVSAVGAGFALGGGWLAVCVTGAVTYDRL